MNLLQIGYEFIFEIQKVYHKKIFPLTCSIISQSRQVDYDTRANVYEHGHLRFSEVEFYASNKKLLS